MHLWQQVSGPDRRQAEGAGAPQVMRRQLRAPFLVPAPPPHLCELRGASLREAYSPPRPRPRDGEKPVQGPAPPSKNSGGGRSWGFTGQRAAASRPGKSCLRGSPGAPGCLGPWIPEEGGSRVRASGGRRADELGTRNDGSLAKGRREARRGTAGLLAAGQVVPGGRDRAGRALEPGSQSAHPLPLLECPSAPCPPFPPSLQFLHWPPESCLEGICPTLPCTGGETEAQGQAAPELSVTGSPPLPAGTPASHPHRLQLQSTPHPTPTSPAASEMQMVSCPPDLLWFLGAVGKSPPVPWKWVPPHRPHCPRPRLPTGPAPWAPCSEAPEPAPPHLQGRPPSCLGRLLLCLVLGSGVKPSELLP